MLRYDCEANVVYISKYTASPNKAIGLPSDLMTAWSYIDGGRVGSQFKVFYNTSLGFLMGSRSGLCDGQLVSKSDVETLSHKLSPTNPGIVTLEYVY